MSGPRRVFFIALSIALLAALFIYTHQTAGLKIAVHQSVMVALIQLYFPLSNRFLRAYPRGGRDGWKCLGPTQTSLLFAGMPLFIAVILIVNDGVDLVFFNDTRGAGFLALLFPYLDQPRFLAFVAACVIVGLATGWVRRVRWTHREIEFREIDGSTTRIAWAEIDHVVLGGPWVANAVVLKDGTRREFPKLDGRVGLSELDAEAQARGIVLWRAGDPPPAVAAAS